MTYKYSHRFFNYLEKTKTKMHLLTEQPDKNYFKMKFPDFLLSHNTWLPKRNISSKLWFGYNPYTYKISILQKEFIAYMHYMPIMVKINTFLEYIISFYQIFRCDNTLVKLYLFKLLFKSTILVYAKEDSQHTERDCLF